ncbi:hypothetical protein [Lentzea sp. NPDC059081]|uniref:hypothetical protein n=1 Tax=Lentzea sp. NPDC059081 TaxID=3346719 RepID=UPI0036C9840F
MANSILSLGGEGSRRRDPFGRHPQVVGDQGVAAGAAHARHVPRALDGQVGGPHQDEGERAVDQHAEDGPHRVLAPGDVRPAPGDAHARLVALTAAAGHARAAEERVLVGEELVTGERAGGEGLGGGARAGDPRGRRAGTTESGQVPGDGLGVRPGATRRPQSERTVLAQRFQCLGGGPVVLLGFRRVGAQDRNGVGVFDHLSDSITALGGRAMRERHRFIRASLDSVVWT